MEKAWTFYWLDGHKSVLYGKTVEEAFNKSYGGGAVNAVDFYTEHITSTHFWVPGDGICRGQWEKKTPAVFDSKFSTMAKENDLQNSIDFLAKEIMSVFNSFSEFSVKYDNKDVLTLRSTVGLYHPEGYVSAIELAFNEYYEGRYDDAEAEPGDHYYMSCDGEYFRPKDLREAIKAFITRAISKRPYSVSGSTFATNIQTIAAEQDKNDILF